MFSLYSRNCEYAVRALVKVMSAEDVFSVEQLCRRAKTPEAYTRKAFQKLAKAGILKTLRGPGGGYRFGRDLKRITILDLIKAIDGEDAMDRCVMGLTECGKRDPCVLHSMWSEVQLKYIAELKKKTLADLVQGQAAKRQ